MGKRAKCYEYHGEVKTINAWAREKNVHTDTIRKRMAAGMTFAEALEAKVDKAKYMAIAREAKKNILPPPIPQGVCTAKCRKCYHGSTGSGYISCDYILNTGHRRPCLAGKGCTEFTTKPRKKPNTNGLIRKG